MILSDVKSYLVERKRVDLVDLSNRFDVDADALRGMLDVWVRKGRLRRIDSGDACGGCCGCTARTPEVYEWLG